MSKRGANTELNQDNWDDEEVPEEAGVFKVFSPDGIQNRVFRTAKRRITSSPNNITEEKKSAFSGFTGFNFAYKPPTGVSSQSSPFASLKSKTQEEKKEDTLSMNKSNESENSSVKYSRTVYLSRLRGLNEHFIEWIREHVEKKNPCCILTPVFRDYEKYLEEIRKECGEPPLNVSEEEKVNENLGSVCGDSKEPIRSTSEEKSTKESTAISGTSPMTTSTISNAKTFAAPLFTFSTGSSSKPGEGNQTPKSIFPASQGFSFGNAKPFTFSNVGTAAPSTEASEDASEESEEPPRNEFTQVKEEDSVFSQRVKVFVKKDGNFADRGVGVLYVKPTSKEKYQVVVRADTSLGNILFNILLTEAVPMQRLGKNNVMLVCLPTPDSKPPPTPVLLRAKTSEDADKLLAQLEKYKK
ncbi:hypothetical protein AAG570_002950 [Ranatra chinensis]|uniref:RanBD1 domain-containing protein n=1 Tax=Ranatra chinensis TaxID=642074 RepID=A0ABD0YNB7_9HEMI